MLGVRGVQGYTHDGKCDGTYSEIRDGAHVPSGDILVERGIPKNALQQHTVHERRRTAEWACEQHSRGSLLTSKDSAPQHPERYAY